VPENDDASTAHPRLGLVLGSGAAWGAAHVGVLQVIEEAGIQISTIVGASSGAIIGVGYAAGLSASQIAEWLVQVRWSSFADWRPSRRWTLFDSRPIERALARNERVRDFEDLDRTFGVLAFDIRRRQPVVLRSGPLATALRATVAIPGVLPPVRVDGGVLIDGSLGDRDAVNAARELGADRVIAVRLENPPAPDAPVTARMLDVLSGARRARHRDALVGVPEPDVLIRPMTAGLSRWSSRDVPQLVAAGRKAATEALPRIRQLSASSAERG